MYNKTELNEIIRSFLVEQNEWKLSDFKSFDIDDFIAHSHPTKKPENLKDHLDLTYKYYQKIIKQKNINIKTLLSGIDDDEFLIEMFEAAIYLHDIGKINPFFQARKVKNDKFKHLQDRSDTSQHSKYSAQIYQKYFLSEINKFDIKKQQKFKWLLRVFSYPISQHHSTLKAIEIKENEQIKKLKFIQTKYEQNQFDIDKFELFIVIKLLFSLLIWADYYATMSYSIDLNFENFGEIDNIKFDHFYNHTIIKNILNHKQHNNINDLRSEIFRQSQENLLNNLDKNIFYLEAPTGSGKTLTSLNLAINLIKEKRVNKIYYVFPFNTLIEQTKGVIFDFLGDDISVDIVNSLEPYKENCSDEYLENIETKYDEIYLNRLFMHSNLVLMTHISLFNLLFGISKESNFSLFNLANSLIIIDEIQAYNNALYSYIITFFDFYARLLNIKFIIMSATLPRLDKLLRNESDKFIDLIQSNKFFNNLYFKNRVKLDFTLLGSNFNTKIDFNQLLDFAKDKILSADKILFEFIKKQSARDFFEIIQNCSDFKEYKIFELSGDDNKAYRAFVINESKANHKIIIVATQVIEAGVDIDMDVGFKDISTIDSEEQFLGRINRSASKNGAAYFFNMDNASEIYKNDLRLKLGFSANRAKEILENKDFSTYYENLLEAVLKNDSKTGFSTSSFFENFEENVLKFNFKNIEEKMQLIKNNKFILYFPFTIDISRYQNIAEFDNIDDSLFNEMGELDGFKIWMAYKELNMVKSYTKRKVLLRKINSLMQFFTFNIYRNSEKSAQNPPYFSEFFNGYYFVEDYENFIEDGKFNRLAYSKKSQSIFL